MMTSQEQIVEAVLAFLNAETWEERQRLVEAHRAVLLVHSDEVELVFDLLLAQYQDDEEEIGEIDEINGLTRAQEMPRRIQVCQEVLALVDRTIQPELWSTLQQELAKSLAQNPLGNRAENLEEAIHHYQLALEVCTRQDSPPNVGGGQGGAWAIIQNDLGNVYVDRIRGNRGENIEQAIRYYRLALEVRTYEAFPSQWATTQNNLGEAYRERIWGNRAENIEQAIVHYQLALDVYTGQGFPYEWAMSHHNLALAYLERIRGDKAENVEQAISNSQLALEVWHRQAYPYEWALSHNNLGEAYRERIRGNKADNFEQAISHYQLALQVYSQQDFPYQWAMIQHNLANAYFQRIRGDKAQNFEEAISHYQLALHIWTRQELPDDWALTQYNLANVYQERIRADKAQNLEQAIEHYQQALQIWTRQEVPVQWAMIQNSLANAYSTRIGGNKADNIEKAIDHYQLALQVRTREDFPQDWAMTQNNLAVTYLYRIRESRADSLEKALEHYQLALQVYTREDFPHDWAMAQHNLANAYVYRIRGDRTENLEQAITHFKLALQIFTPQDLPHDWASAQNDLAVVYAGRLRGNRADNLEQAISHYQLALQIRTQKDFPQDWAIIQNNLAVAYLYRIRGNRADNLEKTIRHCNLALQVYTRQDFPYDWAMVHENLGEAYRERTLEERAENLEQAIHHYQQALQIYTSQDFPYDWAKNQQELALTYQNHVKDQSEQAISHYWQALDLFTPQALPHDCRQTAYHLGHLLYDRTRYKGARRAFEIGHQAVEALRGEVRRVASRQQLAQENADLYARLVHTCLLMGDDIAAFEYAVAGKGRAFIDTLASGGFKILTSTLSPSFINDPKLAQYRRLTQEIDNIRLTLRRVLSDEKQRLRHELGARLSELATLWEDLTFDYPNLTATLAAPRLTASEAMTLAADLQATLIEYVQHAGGWSVFVVSKDAIQHVPLDSVDERFLSGCTKWIKSIESKRRVSFGERITRKRLTSVYAALIAPLQKHLPPANQGERLILAPFGLLHQLPLGAAQHPEHDRYLCQAYTLTFTPSLAALRAVLEQARQANWHLSFAEHALHVAYSGLADMSDRLQKSQESAVEMANIFPDVKPLIETQATPDAVATHVANRELIHFYCHGIFEPDNPNQSGLLLHDGFLTVQRIITDLDLTHTHLTALAACQSGRVGLTQGEELVGLIQALLIAGSKSVVATLWKVDESPTQALFEHFYRAIKAGHAPAQALTLATQAIRQTKGWEHPYYWAAFQVSGLAVDMSK